MLRVFTKAEYQTIGYFQPPKGTFYFGHGKTTFEEKAPSRVRIKLKNAGQWTKTASVNYNAPRAVVRPASSIPSRPSAIANPP
jgi:hypothetical protein